MADNTLSFETRVDLSGLQSGMSAASNTVGQFATNTKSTMAAAAQATNQLADAQRQLGAAAAQGNAQAAQVIAQYQAQVAQTQAAVEALGEAEEQEAAVVQRSMSTRMAASAELRVFEGNLGGSTRAAGALLSSLPGLGEAMTAAFPVFGAVALVEILAQMGEKVANISNEYVNLASMEKAYHDQLIADGADEIQSSNQVLASLRERDVLNAELSGGKKGRAQRGAAAGSGFDITQDKGAIADASANLQALQTRMSELQKASQPTQVMSNGRMITVISDDARRAAVLLDEATSSATKFGDQLTAAQLKLSNDENSQTLKDREAGEKSAGNPDQDRLRAIESSFSQQSAAESAVKGHGLTAGEGASFWAQYLTTFTAGSEQARKVLDEYSKYQDEMHKQITASSKKEDPQSLNNEESAANIATMKEMSTYAKQQGEDISHTGDRWREYNAQIARASEVQATAAANLQLAKIAAASSENGITALSASQQIATVHAAEFTEKIKALNDELARLQAQAVANGSINPLGQNMDPKNAAQQSQIKTQISQVQGQSNVSAFNDQTASAKAFSQPYLNAFNDINQGFLGVTNQMILGTQSISRDFANMGAQLVVSVADSFEKMLAKSLQFEIQSTLAHQVANQTKVASDTTASAQTTAISSVSALQQINHEAAVAAASVWASLSGIPLVGPVLGAAAAGATYAGVMALAAFETGGIIPNTGVALVHQGEAVLPKGLTNFLMGAAGSSTSNSSNASMNVNNYGMSDKGFRAAATRNAEHMVNTVHRGMRRQGRI